MVNFVLQVQAFPHVGAFMGGVRLRDFALCTFVKQHLR